jgi:hypothetical protein
MPSTGPTALPCDVPGGCAAADFPETNVLVPIGSVAARSNTPAFKSIVVIGKEEDQASVRIFASRAH